MGIFIFLKGNTGNLPVIITEERNTGAVWRKWLSFLLHFGLLFECSNMTNTDLSSYSSIFILLCFTLNCCYYHAFEFTKLFCNAASSSMPSGVFLISDVHPQVFDLDLFLNALCMSFLIMLMNFSTSLKSRDNSPHSQNPKLLTSVTQRIPRQSHPFRPAVRESLHPLLVFPPRTDVLQHAFIY